MSVILVKSPGTHAFAGNPVIFRFESDTLDPFTLDITIGDQVISQQLFPYGGQSPYQAGIDLSGVLRSYLKEPVYTDNGIISQVSDFFLQYNISIDEITLFTGLAFPGGISPWLAGQLATIGQNLFTYRLNKDFKNFLFTTRTHTDEIRLKDTELWPFIFIHPGKVISFRSGTQRVDCSPMTAGIVCTMDITSVYRMFGNPGFIDIYSGESAMAFRVIIEVARTAEERYSVRFRNSLGVFEVIELTGIAYQAPAYREEKLWKRMTVSGFFEEHRDRLDSRETIEIEAGYKNRSEHDFLQDMIKSDEIYFTYPDGQEYRCLVTAESIRFRQNIVAPSSILLKIRLLTDNAFAFNNELLKVDVLGTEDGDMMVTEDDEKTILI